MNTEVIYKVPRSSDVQRRKMKIKQWSRLFGFRAGKGICHAFEKIIQNHEENARLRQDANKKTRKEKNKKMSFCFDESLRYVHPAMVIGGW